MLAYTGLFASAFLAATVLPAQSEGVLVGLLLTGRFETWLLILAASAGNVLGSVVNWLLGRFIARFEGSRWFPRKDRMAPAERWYRRYGRWSLLLSWMPIIGDPLTVIAGALREPLSSFVILVGIAKTCRYLALVAIARGWS